MLIGSNRCREMRSFKRARLLTAKLTMFAFIVASIACKIAARVPLIATRRLAERDVFTRHDGEMINVLEKYKSESCEVICKGETRNRYALRSRYITFEMFAFAIILHKFFLCAFNYFIAFISLV